MNSRTFSRAHVTLWSLLLVYCTLAGSHFVHEDGGKNSKVYTIDLGCIYMDIYGMISIENHKSVTMKNQVLFPVFLRKMLALNPLLLDSNIFSIGYFPSTSKASSNFWMTASRAMPCETVRTKDRPRLMYSAILPGIRGFFYSSCKEQLKPEVEVSKLYSFLLPRLVTPTHTSEQSRTSEDNSVKFHHERSMDIWIFIF